MQHRTPAPTPPEVYAPKAYLVAHEREQERREWAAELPQQGVWKVTGEAGSGVSSFLIDTAVAAVQRHSSHEDAAGGVVVLTDSKEASARLRGELSERLAESGFVSDAPLVRSVHSLAFAIVRDRLGVDVRLISGAEQDAVIRELLQGQVEDDRGTWPDELRPAMSLVGFARQLRDFLLRAVERGLGPDDLNRVGAEHGIEVWSASGDFLREYQQVMALSGALRLSASALIALAGAMELPGKWHTVIVDDAQHLAPASATLVERLIAQADLAVIGGDLEQSVFRFRGASPEFFRDLGGIEHGVVDLGRSRRDPSRHVMIAPDEATELAAAADYIRRAHLEEQVDYREMAVVVRSAPMLEPVRRALLRTGVPVALNPTDLVLSEQRIVAALLLGMRALYEELSVSEWRELLLGPVGGADPVTLRRLQRGLRRWRPDQRAEDTLRELVTAATELPDFGSVLTDRELDILHRIRGVLDAGRGVVADDGSVEEVLWALWNATGLAQRLSAAALRGGATGSQADRDLDAVMALFDAAGDYTERRPTSSVAAFVEFIGEQVLPTGVRDRRNATPDAVSLLTAHGVAGREFSRVVVVGVQELVWPSLSETGTLFRQEDLVDLIDSGVDPSVPVARIAERLAEERRLFELATSRATAEIVVTAVDDPDGEEAITPSRFVDEYCWRHGLTPEPVRLAPLDFQRAAQESRDDDAPGAYTDSVVRVLARDEMLAELRTAVCDPQLDEHVRRQAARQLARLAEAGVMGAHPGQWWSTTQPSISKALETRGTLSPSRIESLLQCPMRAVLERMVGLDETLDMIYGSMAHAYFEALGRGVDHETALRHVVDARRASTQAPQWKADRDVQDFEAMLERARQWVEATRGTFNVAAVEAEVDVRVGEHTRIRGRLDRLEESENGEVSIVDLKTGATPPTLDATADNPQLTAYQLALSKGVLVDGRVVTAPDDEAPLEVAGAVLVYPNASKSRLATREQAAKTPEELDKFAQRIQVLPEYMAGPSLLATAGPHCDRCAVRALCPVQPEGEVICGE